MSAEPVAARHARFPALDGVRALAALSIVAFHVVHDGFGTFGPAKDLAAHLNCGVALFFLLSGFLLYRPFVVAMAGGRAVDVRSYLVRRIFRIVPLYWTALLLLAIWPGLPGFFGGSWPASMAFLQIYSSAWAHTGLAVAWSLCTEVTFYLALPVYALLVGRATRGRSPAGRFWLELAILVLVAVGSLALHAKLSSGDADTVSLAAMLPATAYLFCGGMFLAVCSVDAATGVSALATRVARHPALCWLAAGAFFLALSYGHRQALGPTNPLYEPLAFLLLLPVTLAPRADRRLDRFLSAKVVAWLGLISYGIYLWHDPLISHVADAMGGVGEIGDGLGVLVGTLVVTIALATASYLLVERPAIAFAHRRRRAAQPAPGSAPVGAAPGEVGGRGPV